MLNPTIPSNFIKNQLAPMLFEAIMERLEDDKVTSQLLLCYSWAANVPEESDVPNWVMTSLGLLEEEGIEYAQ